MTATHITLLVPALFDTLGKAGEALPRLPALQTLLARSHKQPGCDDNYHHCVAGLFGLSCNADAIPVAAYARYADCGEFDDRVWMHVDPVYLEADKDRLLMHGGSRLDLQAEESAALIQELNALYAEDGWRFEAFHDRRWYLALKQQPDVQFHALADVLGRSVDPFLPYGPEQTVWHRFINEVQMLLHATDVNRQRVENNQYPVNSIWCWGAGRIEPQLDMRWQAVYADEPFAKGLAMLAGAPVYSEYSSLASLLSHEHETKGNEEANILIVCDAGDEDILSLDSDHHAQKLLRLEQYWFAPILQAIKQQQIAELSLLACNGALYRLDKKGLKRFWRRPRPLSHYIADTKTD